MWARGTRAELRAMSDGERVLFNFGCDVLMEFQEDLAWKYCLPKFKWTGGKWGQSLGRIRKAGAHRPRAGVVALGRRNERCPHPIFVTARRLHGSRGSVDAHENVS